MPSRMAGRRPAWTEPVNTSAQLGTATGTAVILLIAAATTDAPGRGTPAPYAAWATQAALALLVAISFARAGERPAQPVS